MEYRFYYPDFRIHKEHTLKSKELNKIFGQPIAFWYGSSPYKKAKKIQKRIKRLFDRADPYLPYIVIYSIPDRDLGHHSKGGEINQVSYIDFIKDVERYVRSKYRITKKQMAGLNKVYKKLTDNLFEGDKDETK